MKRWICLLTALLLALTLCACGSRPLDTEWSLVEENAYTLSDGVTVSVWEQDPLLGRSYRLSDGTELLLERLQARPDHVSVGGMLGYQGLSESAQQAVMAEYEAQYQAYCEMRGQQLEQAYADWLDCQEQKVEFCSHPLQFEMVNAAESEQVIFYRASITRAARPHYEGVIEDQVSCMIFHRQTGEKLSMWELFRVPEEQAREQILSYVVSQAPQVPEQALREAFRDEGLWWHSSGIEVCYPAGTLPGEELMWMWSIPYDQLPGLHPWAVPTKQ